MVRKLTDKSEACAADVWLDLASVSPFNFSIEEQLTEQLVLGLEEDSGACQIFLEYVNDFPGFCKNILGVTLWAGQMEMARLVQRFPKVAIAACYGSGKTFWAACLCIWWLWTRRPSLLVSTAPTGRQVKELLWSDIRKIHLSAKVNLGGRILIRETRIEAVRRGLGFSGDKPNSVAGYHERENVMFVEDESAGMKREVIEGYDGLTATPGSKWVKIGNTIASDGPFWDCWNDEREKLIWQTYQISAYGTPNVKGKGALQIGFAPVPGLATLAAWDVLVESVAFPGLVGYRWVLEREHKWGPDHPLFVSKVLGKWYLVAGALSVVPAEWVALAAKRNADYLEGGLKIPTLGVDVGGGVGRDHTVLYKRYGRRAKCVGKDNKKDMPDQADWIVAVCKREGIKRVCVDGTGLGKALFDILRRLKRKGELKGIELLLVKMGNKPTAKGEDEFDGLVDEIWWLMRRAFDPKGPEPLAIEPTDTDLKDELPKRTWGLIGDGDGVIKIERKEDMKKRGIPSPDNADALAATFYEPPVSRSFAA